MAADTATAGSAGNASAEDTLESLLREAEALKQRLEEERQKLNDVTRECSAVAVNRSPLFGNVYIHDFVTEVIKT